MIESKPEKPRSAAEIRQSLRTTYERVEKDLDTLGDLVQSNMNLRRQLVRHPILAVVSGAVVGLVLVKRPAKIARALRRLAGWWAPVVLSALLRPPAPSGERDDGGGGD